MCDRRALRGETEAFTHIYCAYIHYAQPFVCVNVRKMKTKQIQTKERRRKMLKSQINSLAYVKINYLICN